MRQIVLDTETTGLEVRQGHRIIEIAGVEIVNRRLTGTRYHQYLNPDRDIDAGAADVHGLTRERLKNEPRFADVAEEFLAFIKDSELVIHNAPFDVGFIHGELDLLETCSVRRLEGHCEVLDTLVMARQLHPGQKNNLDALCKRYNVNNSERVLHGALLDAQILADVYLLMTGGQTALFGEALDHEPRRSQSPSGEFSKIKELPVIAATAEEQAAHDRRLADLDRRSGGRCLWKVLAS